MRLFVSAMTAVAACGLGLSVAGVNRAAAVEMQPEKTADGYHWHYASARPLADFTKPDGDYPPLVASSVALGPFDKGCLDLFNDESKAFEDLGNLDLGFQQGSGSCSEANNKATSITFFDYLEADTFASYLKLEQFRLTHQGLVIDGVPLKLAHLSTLLVQPFFMGMDGPSGRPVAFGQPLLGLRSMLDLLRWMDRAKAAFATKDGSFAKFVRADLTEQMAAFVAEGLPRSGLVRMYPPTQESMMVLDDGTTATQFLSIPNQAQFFELSCGTQPGGHC